MTKAEKRFQIERTMQCDTARLYASLPEAIAYLQEVSVTHPTAILDEHWTGYESMEMRFVWYSPETDDEFSDRRRREQAAARVAAAAEQEAQARAGKLKEYNRLRRELGL